MEGNQKGEEEEREEGEEEEGGELEETAEEEGLFLCETDGLQRKKQLQARRKRLHKGLVAQLNYRDAIQKRLLSNALPALDQVSEDGCWLHETMMVNQCNDQWEDQTFSNGRRVRWQLWGRCFWEQIEMCPNGIQEMVAKTCT